MSAYTRQKAKSKIGNRIRLEITSQKQSIDTHYTPYDRAKRCREHSEVIRDSACTGKRDWGRNGKESAMAFVRDPSQHSPGVISENHGKPKSGWPDREPNPGPPECESIRLNVFLGRSLGGAGRGGVSALQNAWDENTFLGIEKNQEAAAPRSSPCRDQNAKIHEGSRKEEELNHSAAQREGRRNSRPRLWWKTSLALVGPQRAAHHSARQVRRQDLCRVHRLSDAVDERDQQHGGSRTCEATTVVNSHATNSRRYHDSVTGKLYVGQAARHDNSVDSNISGGEKPSQTFLFRDRIAVVRHHIGMDTLPPLPAAKVKKRGSDTNARLHHRGSNLDPRSDLRSDTQNCCTIRVQSRTGDRDEVHFEPQKLAVRKHEPRSAAIVDKGAVISDCHPGARCHRRVDCRVSALLAAAATKGNYCRRKSRGPLDWPGRATRGAALTILGSTAKQPYIASLCGAAIRVQTPSLLKDVHDKFSKAPGNRVGALSRIARVVGGLVKDRSGAAENTSCSSAHTLRAEEDKPRSPGRFCRSAVPSRRGNCLPGPSAPR
ncbi:hypothetical protein PR048_028720 [Dryococelus australis]|uniref:Uncharacterized protein n=1 Tax=Dryococelus australis TaxID=614101 RepID=A0ABQ9GBC6_9NEOP|nr:hypothetical protein PR048_028720 [Dryococelus australis]